MATFVNSDMQYTFHASSGNVSNHAKIGPDRFSRFDVYWSQTNRQTSKVYIYR